MELVKAIPSNSLVALDANVFIYFYEQHPEYVHIVRPLFDQLTQGTLTAVTSIVTLIELTTLPLREKRNDLVQTYSHALLDAKNLSTIEVNVAIARKSTELRAAYGLRTPDAIQLATGIVAGATAFITNDVRLKKVSDIMVLVISEYAD